MGKRKNKKKKQKALFSRKTKRNKKIGHNGGVEMVLSEINITWDPLLDDIDYPDELQDEIDRLYHLTVDKPKEAIEPLERFREKYPNVKKIYNFLSVAYSNTKQHEKTHAIIRECLEKYPDYLFAKLAHAEICLMANKLDEIPGIFDNKLDLKMLYPEKDTFHISEVIGFQAVIGMYFAKTGNTESAKSCLNVLQQLDPDDPFTTRLEAKLAVSGIKENMASLFS